MARRLPRANQRDRLHARLVHQSPFVDARARQAAGTGARLVRRLRRGNEMNKIAIAFLTKDRVDLSKRTIAPLLQPDKFDFFWIDGSDEVRGQGFVESFRGKVYRVYGNVKGGADTAVVYA